MSPNRLKLLPLCIATLISAPVGAVGLGDIELHSQLGNPLEAVIPLSHLGELGAEQLRIGLGSEDDYSKLGVDYTYQHTLIRLEPIVRDGRGYVRLVTRDPVTEPYLNFVLNLRWPQGQVVREYTVLLDPPEHAAALAPQAADSGTALAVAQPASAVRAAMATEIPAPSVPAAAGDAYTVRSGDSLWKLAARWRPAGVSVEQMMGALHHANPDAFVGNDPSRLRAGGTLQLPSAEQIAAAAPLNATPAAPHREIAAESAPAPTAPQTPEPAPLPIPIPISSGARDEELVAENTALKAQIGELSSNVAALTENLGASQERLHELEAKIGSLVDQLERQRVTTQQLASAAGVTPPRADSVVNDAQAGDLLAPPPAKTPWWVHGSYWIAIAGLGAWVGFNQWSRRRQPLLAELELPHDDRSARAAAEIETRLMPEPVAGIPVAGTPVPKAPATGMPATAPGNYWQHPADAGGTLDDLPLDLVDPPPAIDAVPERPTFADVTVTRTAEDSVDPIISAGVFTAFGRYDDAEQVLVEALQRHPERIDLKLHLLDVYKHQDNREAFVALADAIELEHATDDATLAELASLRRQYMA